jgi:tetratricopeptide (TPR) repeat protein
MHRGDRARIFVSVTQADRVFGELLARALSEAGADIWLSGGASEEDGVDEERELRLRPIFLAILSPAAFASGEVREACALAYALCEQEPERVFLPVMAPGYGPYRASEAIARTLRKLGLTRPVRVPSPVSHSLPETTVVLSQAQSLATKLFSPDALAQARQLFEHATQLDPGDVSAWSGLGDMCALLQCDADALAAFEHALMLSPENTELWCDVGAMRSRLGNYAAALVAYEQALALDPDSLRALEQRGRMLVALERPSEALASYDAALARHPGEAHLWHAHGNALQSLERHADAIASFDRALALWPHFTWVWRDKAVSLRILGRHSEAGDAERHASGWAS